MSTARPIFECSGCGRVTREPEKDLETLRKAGHVSCCPERDMRQLGGALIDSKTAAFAKAACEAAGYFESAAVLAKAPSAVVEAPAERVAPFAKLPPQPEPDRHTDFEGCHSEFAMTSYGRKCADAQRNLDAETVAKSAAYAARLREALAAVVRDIELSFDSCPPRYETLRKWRDELEALAESATTGKEPG